MVKWATTLLVIFYFLVLECTFVCVQIGMFFDLGEWTDAGGEKTFVHTTPQFFQGLAAGLVMAAVIPTLIAGIIGYGILGLRGHYFAICTLA